METTFIYALTDPVTNEIRYVGKADDPKDRFYHHVGTARRSTSNHKGAWIRGLLNAGIKPGLIILEEVSKDNWEEAEKRHIAEQSKNGKLLNVSPGGEGREAGFRHSELTRAKIGAASKGNHHAKGRKYSEEERKSRSDYRHSDETKAKMSARRMGHSTPEVTRQKIRMGNFISGSKRSKLTEEQVRCIRNEYAEGNVTMDKLHQRYGISLERVHSIIHRKAFAHVE